LTTSSLLPHQVEVIIRNFGGEILILQVFTMTEAVSHAFLNRMELMLVSFPSQVHVTKTFRPGQGFTRLEIDLIRVERLLPPPVYPSFEQLFHRG
jgi:hypothetical protein